MDIASETVGVPSFNIVCEGNHANSLPDTQADTGRHTTVETFYAVLLVDVRECVHDGRVDGTVGGFGHGLHLWTRG